MRCKGNEKRGIFHNKNSLIYYFSNNSRICFIKNKNLPGIGEVFI